MTYRNTSKNCVHKTKLSLLGNRVTNRNNQLNRSSESAIKINTDMVTPNRNWGRSKA
jgi:hypothetical protein